MIFKFGTRKAFQHHRAEMPEEVFSHLQYSIDLLDENYGAERDIDHDDGGFVLLFTHAEDWAQIRSTTNIDFTSHIPEWVDHISTESEDYAAALYLISNDFGIILSAPVHLLSQLMTQ